MFKPPTAAALGLSCVLLLSGCAAQHLRDAQDRFNAASAEEAAASLDNPTALDKPSGLNVYGPALTDYRLALSLVDKALKDDASDLESDKLTGTAYTLRCVTLWRISDLDPPADAPKPDERSPAQQAAASCASEGTQQVKDKKMTVGTRDGVMLSVLPAFIDMDVARRVTTYERARTFLADSRTTIDGAIKTLEQQKIEGHDMWVYLHLAEVRNLRSWRAAIFRFRSVNAPLDAELATNRQSLVDQYCTLKPRFASKPGLEKFMGGELQLAGISVPPCS